ncbi:MAG: hypothetical protein FWG59_04650 [Betaproteobacteria bacterium]|nr:hypothetical protein [Betaproteobacteria bacterium]
MMRVVCCTALLGGMLLAGCSGGNPPVEPEPLSPLVAFISSAQPTASAQLDDPAFGSGILVTLEEAFVSASGEDCRRAAVIAREREAEMVVVCRAEEGQPWKMMPRIMGSAHP